MCPSHPGFSELQTSTFPCSLNTTTLLTQRYTDCTKADQGHVPPFNPLTGLSVPTLPIKDCTLGQNDKTILDDSSFYAIQMHSVLRAKSLPVYKVSMVGVLHLSRMRTKHSRSFIYHLSAQNCQPQSSLSCQNSRTKRSLVSSISVIQSTEKRRDGHLVFWRYCSRLHVFQHNSFSMLPFLTVPLDTSSAALLFFLSAVTHSDQWDT